MKKFLRALFIFAMLPMIFNIVTATEMTITDRLDGILADINNMKQEYTNEIAKYPEVINALSTENKALANDLQNRLLDDDINTRIQGLRQELSGLSVDNKDKVIDAINELQLSKSRITTDNRDAILDAANNINNISASERTQIISKAKQIVTSLGANTDVTDTYNEVNSTLDRIDAKGTEINNMIKTILDNNSNLAILRRITDFNLISKLYNDVKINDKEALIDDISSKLGNSTDDVALKNELNDIKQKAIELKNEITSLENIDANKVMLFGDVQKTAISNKIKNIERDYVAFAKLVIDENFEDYAQIIVDIASDEPIDTLILRANQGLDLISQYKNTVKQIKSGNLTSFNVSNETKQKVAIILALDFVDLSEYNREYIETNFSTQINNVTNYIIGEFTTYLNSTETSLRNSITTNINAEVTVELSQVRIKDMTTSAFETLDKIAELKARIDAEILVYNNNLKAKLDRTIPLVYNVYNNHILDTIESTMTLEGQKSNKAFEYNSAYNYIVSDTFMVASNFNSKIGIPTNKLSILTYTGLKESKFKTGATLKIELSDTLYQEYSIAVLGDAYADGNIDARDYMAIKNHIMGRDTLSAIKRIASDTYRDSGIDARDYMMIKNHIMGRDSISL